MVRLRRFLAGMGCLLFLCGCQTLMGPVEPVPFPDALQTRALALEARGDATAAIRYWEAASAVAAEKLTALEAQRRERIDAELVAAEAALAEGQVDRGITHLLKVLRLAPSHAVAKERLRGTFSRGLVVAYTARSGDSAETIAGRVYKNVRLGSLVEALYGSEAEKGRVLWLPSVDASLVAAQFSYSRAMVTARKLYKAEAWRELLVASEEILSYAPGDKEALFLKNTAAHNLAEALFQEEAYREALAMYRRVDPYFKNETPRIKAILAIQKQLRDEARARRNTALLTEANHLMKSRTFVKARKVLDAVDEGFPGRVELDRLLTKKMNRVAEVHYRRGVQLFLDEDLIGAIAEWEKCLEFNPKHEKAGEGVSNAKRLLEKVKGIQPKKGGGNP